MDNKTRKAIENAVASEPFAQQMDMRLVELEDGHSVVCMRYRPERMANIYARAHGGALFALIDEAFETAAQTDGTIAVALNVNVTYAASPRPGCELKAEARLTSQTKKTAGYYITVVDDDERLIAYCQALAYRTGKPFGL